MHLTQFEMKVYSVLKRSPVFIGPKIIGVRAGLRYTKTISAKIRSALNKLIKNGLVEMSYNRTYSAAKGVFTCKKKKIDKKPAWWN